MWKSKPALAPSERVTSLGPWEKLKFFSPADNRGEARRPRRGTNTKSFHFIFHSLIRREKKWHRVVLAPTEWHQAELQPLVIFLAQLDSDGRLRPALWGKLGLKNRIKLKSGATTTSSTTTSTTKKKNSWRAEIKNKKSLFFCSSHVGEPGGLCEPSDG